MGARETVDEHVVPRQEFTLHEVEEPLGGTGFQKVSLTTNWELGSCVNCIHLEVSPRYFRSWVSANVSSPATNRKLDDFMSISNTNLAKRIILYT